MNIKTTKFYLYRQFLFLILITFVSSLTGCGDFDLFEDEVKPEPVYTLDLTLNATNQLNPDIENRASPVVVRIYHLKNADTFKSSDFFAVYENDEVLLGKDILYRKELEIKPNDEIFHSEKLNPETLFLGIFAAFRDLDKAIWQLVIPVTPKQTSSFEVGLNQFSLALKEGDGSTKVQLTEEEIEEAYEKAQAQSEAEKEAEEQRAAVEPSGGGQSKEDNKPFDFFGLFGGEEKTDSEKEAPKPPETEK